ncbi:glycosyltransferase family 4 protein [Sinorhizobium chiapasense]|uniref:Glycosyltransferase family 4 protein n=1 Tax=Sinorhizobium chiapasense TaxID=501572 RepID=A0ABZ2BKV8_9HYPH
MDSTRGIDSEYLLPTRGRIVIAFPFLGDHLGGSHISAIGLIAGLDKTKFHPLVILHKRGLILDEHLRSQNIPVVTAPNIAILSPEKRRKIQDIIAMGAGFFGTTARLTHFLRLHNVDIVHTNDGRMHATWALAARIAGSKLLWHHRGDPSAYGVNTLAPLLANHIVTVSKFVQPARPIVPVAHKTTVLHSPFDHPRTLPDREDSRRRFVEELRLPPDTRFVGYVGGLIERKRPVRFVEAVHAFLRQHPAFPLAGMLFGSSPADGPDLGHAVRQRAEELGISNRIHLMGFRMPVEPCMSALDALLVPAVNEPFGRTLIEAMLLGTPVIATDHGGNPEAIDDGITGYLVEAERPEAMVPPLERLLFDKEQWTRISATARDASHAQYGRQAHVDGISRLYETLVARNNVKSVRLSPVHASSSVTDVKE